ncbi:MAG: RHS repeat-associated core domain-containing protein, partial [Anaerolineales bacterium]|nr:RHS repeat-associated core domain-containing protein [Anaerolineales bacterium]
MRTNIASGPIVQTDYGYTGQRNLDDDLGLMDYKARFYSPVLNRFIQPDNIIPGIFNPQNLNRFSYVRNNSIIYIDPTGHMACQSNYCDPRWIPKLPEGVNPDVWKGLITTGLVRSTEPGVVVYASTQAALEYVVAAEFT